VDSIHNPPDVSARPQCLARCCECFHVSGDNLRLLAFKPESVTDGPYIRAMLVQLPATKARKLHRKWGFLNWRPQPGARYFTCRHFDHTTRLCKAYDERPGMCRSYGETVPCSHGCGCGTGVASRIA